MSLEDLDYKDPSLKVSSDLRQNRFFTKFKKVLWIDKTKNLSLPKNKD